MYPGMILVMFSDGVSSSWTRQATEDLLTLESTEMARKILKQSARDNDDATVLVVRVPGEQPPNRAVPEGRVSQNETSGTLE